MFSAIIDLKITPNEYVFPEQVLWELINGTANTENWEKMYVYSSETPIVSSSAKELISDSFKKNNVYYGMEVPALQPRVMVQTKDTRFIFYCHYGDTCILFELIKESLIKNGVSETSIIRSKNDLLINGKKAIGYMGIKQNGLIAETALITFNYDDVLFKSLLPETFYRKGFPIGETGITGVINEFPNVDMDVVVNFIYNEAISRAIPYSVITSPLSFENRLENKIEIINILQTQQMEAQSSLIGGL